MRFLYLVILLIGLTVNGKLFGQETVSPETKSDVPKLILKTDLLSLIDFYPTLQIGLEYKVAEKLYFENSIGYIFAYWWEKDRVGESGLFDIADDIINPRGIKFRGESKFFFKSPLKEKKGTFYLAPEFVFRHIKSDGQIIKELSCNNDDFFGQCYYNQFYSYKVEQFHYFTNFKGGFQFFKNEKLMMDFFFGVGLKWKVVKETGKPYPLPGDRIIAETLVEEAFTPHITLGFKLGYALK